MKAYRHFCFVLTAAIFLVPKITSAQNIPNDTVNHCKSISNPDQRSIASPALKRQGTSNLEKELTEKEILGENKNNVSSQTKQIVLAGINIPSLWWAREQFDPFGGRLINNWLAHPNLKQVDITVNWQLWTLLDYLGRYRFLNQFGTVVREYGYELRVLDQQKQCLGIYEYNSRSNPPKWEIKLENSGQDSLQVEPIDY